MNRIADAQRRQDRADHLRDPAHNTYYTDARVIDDMTVTATIGPSTTTTRFHSGVPSVAAAETQAILEEILLH